MEFILFLDQFLFCVMENNNDNYHNLECFDVFKSSFTAFTMLQITDFSYSTYGALFMK